MDSGSVAARGTGFVFARGPDDAGDDGGQYRQKDHQEKEHDENNGDFLLSHAEHHCDHTTKIGGFWSVFTVVSIFYMTVWVLSWCRWANTMVQHGRRSGLKWRNGINLPLGIVVNDDTLGVSCDGVAIVGTDGQ